MKLLFNIFTLALLTQVLFSFKAYAVNHHNYYPLEFQNSLDTKMDKNNKGLTKAGQEILKSYLFKILSSYHQEVSGAPDKLGCSRNSDRRCYRHSSLGYRGARKILFGKIHLAQNANGFYVKDVYCRKVFTKRQANIGPNRIPNSKILNCEHTWPQSKFTARFNNNLQKSDLHHLYPTDSKANNKRGNYPFGDVDDSDDTLDGCDPSRLGEDALSSGNRDKFEPPQEHKGNVARALFYFSIRYQINISKEEEAYLRDWHIQDPVDVKERERNEIIYRFQKNRNPFIDYPELVRKISDF